MVLDSVTSAQQCIRQPRPRVYLKEGTNSLSETARCGYPGKTTFNLLLLVSLFACSLSLSSLSLSLPPPLALLGANHGEHCGLDREEASRTYARWMTGSSQAPPPTDDFGDPFGKGLPSATAELSTVVPVGPPRITHPEAPTTVTCSSDCDLQLHCRLAQMVSLSCARACARSLSATRW